MTSFNRVTFTASVLVFSVLYCIVDALRNILYRHQTMQTTPCVWPYGLWAERKVVIPANFAF